MIVWKSLLMLHVAAVSGVLGRPTERSESGLSGYRLLDVLPQTSSQVSWLQRMESSETPGLDFYSHPSSVSESVSVAVHPVMLEYLQSMLEEKNISFAVTSEDLQVLVDNQMEDIAAQEAVSQGDHLVFRDPSISYYDLSNYNRLTVIEKRLRELERLNSQLVSVESLGRTHENRDIKVVRVSNGVSNKAVIIMDCGIHAREWISPAFCMHVIEKLVEEREQGMLRHFDFLIVPVANPDGYEYTWNSNRMWRKNRRPKGAPIAQDQPVGEVGVEVEVELAAQTRQSLPGWPAAFPGWPNLPGSESHPAADLSEKCVGVDPNRNFAIGFGTVGSSRSWCSDTFHGDHAFSEAESLALKQLVVRTKSRQRIAAYLSVHAYSQFWMSPFGYKKSAATHASDHLRVARVATQALSNVFGTQYKIGPINKVIYQAAGSSVDWVYDIADVKYAFALELRDKGRFGFLLPVNQIEETNKETWAGLNAMAWAIAKEFPIN